MTAELNSPNHNQFNAMLQQAWKQHQAGQLQVAEDAYLQLLSASPGDPDTNNLIGLLYIQTRRPAIAEAHIRKALETEASNPQTLYNMGIACKDQCKWNDAAEAFKQCVEFAPNHVDGINSLANILRLQGHTGEALQWFNRALRLQPRHPLVHCNLGYLSLDQQNHQEAEKHFSRALSLSPRLAEALKGLAEVNMGLGLACEQSGQLNEAASHYQAAINVRPDLAAAHFYLAHLRSHRSSEAECDAMELLFEDTGSKDSDRVKLAFGLGFAHESRENYSRAFRFMRKGHHLQKRAELFSLAAEAKRFRSTIDTFDFDAFDQLKSVGILDERPVFIVGMPRSGTTLAEQILASHSGVHGNGESTLVAKSANHLQQNFRQITTAGLSGIGAEKWQCQAQVILDALVENTAGAIRITDTSPMNFLYIGAIAIMLPTARIVYCRREAMDNCLSIYRQYLTGPHGYAHELTDLGKFYKLHLKLMEHWQKVLPGRIHTLHYDRLVSDPEPEIRALLDFCQLSFERQCLSFHEGQRVVRSPSASQVHQPLYSTSVGAWKHYQKELEPLAGILTAGQGRVS